MPTYEYKVIPAPARGIKERGVKATGDRFALAMAKAMNDLGAEGWEYQRSDSLPCEERVGFTGRTTTFQHMLVFRRVIADGATAEIKVESAPASAKKPLLAAKALTQSGAAPKIAPLGAKNTAPEATKPAPSPKAGAEPQVAAE